MVKYGETSKKTQVDLKLSFKENPSSEIVKTIDKLNSQYGKYAVSVVELRKTIDRQMGQRKLTAELYAMREER